MKPFMVEFAGCAEAGKTTTIKELVNRFSELGYKVGYIRESAEITDRHIPKMSIYYHISSRLITINKIIELYHNDDYNLILIDRGLLDGIIFTMHLMALNPGLNLFYQYSQLIGFIDSLKELYPDLFFIFKTDPEISIARRGGEGTLVTADFVKQQNVLYASVESTLEVPHFTIDTSKLSKEAVVNKVLNTIIMHM